MTRNTCARLLAGLAAVLCLGLWTPGFSQAIEFTVKGELHSATPRAYSQYLVQMVDVSHRVSTAHGEVRGDGSFEVRNVTSGEYRVTVTTLMGDTVLEQMTTVYPQMGILTVRMPEGPQNRPGARTVSMKELLHPPSKKAFHSFVEAQKLSSSGDYAKAADALERAVEESPQYAEAHVNLGVQYMRMGRFEAATAELSRAIEIAGPSAITLCNLASAQSRLGRREQAIESARAAVKLDGAFPQAHLMLGALLFNDPRSRAEGIAHLEKVADTFPSAREILNKVKQAQ